MTKSSAAVAAASKSNFAECPVCLEPFSSSTTDDRTPLMGHCCHNLCRTCVKGIIKSTTEQRKNKNKVVNIRCPLCNDEKSFKANKLSVNHAICDALAFIETHIDTEQPYTPLCSKERQKHESENGRPSSKPKQVSPEPSLPQFGRAAAASLANIGSNDNATEEAVDATFASPALLANNQFSTASSPNNTVARHLSPPGAARASAIGTNEQALSGAASGGRKRAREKTGDDQGASSTTNRRSKNPPSSPEVIDLSSSSDEEDAQDNTTKFSSCSERNSHVSSNLLQGQSDCSREMAQYEKLLSNEVGKSDITNQRKKQKKNLGEAKTTYNSYKELPCERPDYRNLFGKDYEVREARPGSQGSLSLTDAPTVHSHHKEFLIRQPDDWHDSNGGDDDAANRQDEQNVLLNIKRSIQQDSGLEKPRSGANSTSVKKVATPSGADNATSASKAGFPSMIAKMPTASVAAATIPKLKKAPLQRSNAVRSKSVTREKKKSNGKRSIAASAQKSNSASSWIEDMHIWMLTVNHGKRNQVCTLENAGLVKSRVELLATGKGVGYKRWNTEVVNEWGQVELKPIFFKKGVEVDLSFDFVKMLEEAKAFETEHGKDAGHGWVIQHALRKLQLYKEYRNRHSVQN